jgi:hypothetical protein
VVVAPGGRSETVWRRVPVWHVHLSEDRPNSDAFTSDVDDSGAPDGMSVVIERIANELGRTHVDALNGHDKFGLVRLDADLLEELGLVVTEDPTDSEPAHGVVAVQTKRQSRTIAKRCTWLIRPQP